MDAFIPLLHHSRHVRSWGLYFRGLRDTFRDSGDGPWSHLDDLPGLHGQRGEVSAAVDRDALAQDGVQTPHLIPTQHADPPALLRGIRGGHDDPDNKARSAGCERL